MSRDTRPRLAMLGVGRMGEAVLAGLQRAGWPLAELLAVEPDAVRAELIHATHGVKVLGAAEAAAAAEVLVVAVKPQQVVPLLDLISPFLRPGALVISLAAGTPLAVLESHLPAGTAVVRVMPNTPALVGQGMSVMSPGQACGAADLEMARSVLSAVGRVTQVPESAQDAVTAVSGSGPAYVFYLAEAMIDAGVMLGLPRATAAELVGQTLLGAATLLTSGERIASGEQHPGLLRENVTSPGGTTAAALHVLDARAVRAAVADAMAACRDHSARLSQQAQVSQQAGGGK